jgi:molybdopterin-containing oxidoreductase family iron-sulfur binding subunit
MKNGAKSGTKPADIMKEHGCGLSPERPATKPLDMATVRRRLEEARGPQYWRSLEELAQTEGFDELMRDEFPRHASQWMDPESRRTFLKLMGASLALAGLSGCTRQPDEYIVPYVKQPEELIPGKPLFYATAMTMGGVGMPLLAESHMGRPTKLEGNPEHPASGGATDVWAQASILSLYDPERSQALTYVGDVRPWGAFLGAMRGPVNVQRAARGAGFRILTETICSPTLAEQIEKLLKAYPEARWHQYDPVNRDAAREGARLAFGEYVEPQFRVEKADVILALDADFLGCGPASLRSVREFAARRRPEARMNRLYVIESTPTPTGGKADHRLAARASEVEAFARMIAAARRRRSQGCHRRHRDRQKEDQRSGCAGPGRLRRTSRPGS